MALLLCRKSSPIFVHNAQENKINLASFEEDMYYKLVERYSKYHNAFEQRRIASEEVCNQLEEQKNRLSKEIKLINIEIDYIEEKIRLGTA